MRAKKTQKTNKQKNQKKKHFIGNFNSSLLVHYAQRKKLSAFFILYLKMRGRLSQKYLTSKENMKQIKIWAICVSALPYSLAALPPFD